MSKARMIGNKIAKAVAINKIVTPNMQKSIRRKFRMIDRLNKIAVNADKLYGAEQVQRAKTALRKIAAYSYATTESPTRHNSDSWRVKDKLPATGKQKVRLGASAPKI